MKGLLNKFPSNFKISFPDSNTLSTLSCKQGVYTTDTLECSNSYRKSIWSTGFSKSMQMPSLYVCWSFEEIDQSCLPWIPVQRKSLQKKLSSFFPDCDGIKAISGKHSRQEESSKTIGEDLSKLRDEGNGELIFSPSLWLDHNFLWIDSLLAPTRALYVMMCYYIYSRHPLFQIFTHHWGTGSRKFV